MDDTRSDEAKFESGIVSRDSHKTDKPFVYVVSLYCLVPFGLFKVQSLAAARYECGKRISLFYTFNAGIYFRFTIKLTCILACQETYIKYMFYK